MGISSNCTPNNELPVEIINPEEEDSCKTQEFLEVVDPDKKEEFLEDADSNLCSSEFFDAQCQITNVSQEPTPCEPSTSSMSTSKDTWPTKRSQMGGVNKFFMWLLSFCLPINGAGFSSSGSSGPFMVCVPSSAPAIQKQDQVPEKKRKPVGMITRIKDADFIAGRLVGGCTCGRRDGLSAACPRMCCQDNPGCHMNPPQCWPQFKEPPPPPPPPPPQKIICVPIELVYADPSGGKIT